MAEVTETTLATVDLDCRRTQEIKEMAGPYGRAVLLWHPGLTYPGWWGWTVTFNAAPAPYRRREWTSRDGNAVREMLATGRLVRD